MINEVALEKLRHYCAYQDRCHQEVRSKLLSLKVYGDELEDIMGALISEDFLNEERFARSFARGKFRMKRWGRIKIKQELKKRKISDYCIRKGMSEIEEEAYEQTIVDLIEKYQKANPKIDKRHVVQKTLAHLQRKGFETNLVLKELKKS